MDYAPADDIEYFKSADEAAEAEQSVLGRDFIKLMKKRGWVLQPGESAVYRPTATALPQAFRCISTRVERSRA